MQRGRFAQAGDRSRQPFLAGMRVRAGRRTDLLHGGTAASLSGNTPLAVCRVTLLSFCTASVGNAAAEPLGAVTKDFSAGITAPKASRLPSRPAPTETSGSAEVRQSNPRRSGASPRQVWSPSFRLESHQKAGQPESPPAPTAISGSRENKGGKIGRITTTGTVTKFPVTLESLSGPTLITGRS